MSQSIGVRVIRKVNTLLSREGKERVCDALPQLENEIRGDLDRAVKRRDYPGASKQVNELVFLAQVMGILCPTVARPRGRLPWEA